MARWTATRRPKRHIFDRQRDGDTAVLGIDDPMTAGRCRSPAFASRANDRPMSGCDGRVLRDAAGPIVVDAACPARAPITDRTPPLRPRWQPALGLDRDAVAAGITSFPGLAHRQQRVATIDGVPWINDSKATNADAAARALACYDRIVWIAGGSRQGGRHRRSRAVVPAHRPCAADRAATHRCSRSNSMRYPVHAFAARWTPPATGRARSRQGLGADAVLLSPACASFDQFAGFEARGDRFATL